MAIPASKIVKINPRVLQASGVDLQINGMFLDTSALIPAGGVVGFTSPDAVGDFFGTASNEYKAAQIYFLGYDNSFKKPRQIWFGSRVSSAVGAWLRGAKYTGDLDDLKAITSGALTITIDGTQAALTSISLASTSIASFSDVASAIQTKLQAVTGLSSAACTYSSQTGAFQISSGTTGASSTITYCSDSPLAALLNLREDDGAVLSKGSDALDVAANMRSIRKATENWATFTTLTEVASADGYAEAVEYAEWASSQGVEYLYVCWGTADNLKSTAATDTNSLAAKLAAANVGATTLVYGDLRYAAFIMGEAASIDWEREQGAITFAFKSQQGLPPVVGDEADAQNLLAKKCNLYGAYATRNDEFVWLYAGNMFGDYRYIDPFINAAWFNNALQVAIMNGFKNTPRVPYNDDGYTRVRSWCQDPINRARKNGVIDPNIVLSEAQKAEVIREAGLDIISNLETDGYYLQISDAGPSVRTTRDTPNCSLWYTYGSSIHRIELASTLLI